MHVATLSRILTATEAGQWHLTVLHTGKNGFSPDSLSQAATLSRENDSSRSRISSLDEEVKIEKEMRHRAEEQVRVTSLSAAYLILLVLPPYKFRHLFNKLSISSFLRLIEIVLSSFD